MRKEKYEHKVTKKVVELQELPRELKSNNVWAMYEGEFRIKYTCPLSEFNNNYIKLECML